MGLRNESQDQQGTCLLVGNGEEGLETVGKHIKLWRSWMRVETY